MLVADRYDYHVDQGVISLRAGHDSAERPTSLAERWRAVATNAEEVRTPIKDLNCGLEAEEVKHCQEEGGEITLIESQHNSLLWLNRNIKHREYRYYLVVLAEDGCDYQVVADAAVSVNLMDIVAQTVGNSWTQREEGNKERECRIPWEKIPWLNRQSN